VVRRRAAWVLLVVLLVLQAVGLYSADAPGPGGVPGLDKVGHLLAFALPAAVAGWLRSRRVVVLLVVHAVVSEPLQGWLTPARQPDPLDAAADLVGIALGLLLARSLRGAAVPPSGKMGR
jgi:VanZ family protein